MASFAGATEWLNSEPLGSAEVRVDVVLVNFWTWTRGHHFGEGRYDESG